MRRWVWICGVTTSNVVTTVLQGTQSRLTWQNTLFKTLNFVTKVFMMHHLLMSNCLFGMCCQAWICGVTRKNVVSLVLQGAPSDKLFFTSYILQAPLVNSLCFLQFRVDENFDSLPHEDLPTIDMETGNAARRRSGIHRATCASYTREFTDASHANVSNDEAGAHSRNPGRRRGDKDLCHSKEGAGSPVSTQKRERATQMCSEATAILLHWWRINQQQHRR